MTTARLTQGRAKTGRRATTEPEFRGERVTADGAQDVNERRGRWLQRLGMAEAERLPTSTMNAPLCHAYRLSHAGLAAANWANHTS